MSRLSTKHMVLGLVVERQTYGYALQQQLDERFGFLRFAGSSVYSVLQRLERDGWVEPAGSNRLSDERRQPYRATPAGVAAFQNWMTTPSERPLLRDELQAKLGLATPDDLPELLAQAEGQLATCVAELTSAPKPSLAIALARDTTWSAAARMLADDYQTEILEGTVDWLTSTVEVLKAHIARQAADQP